MCAGFRIKEVPCVKSILCFRHRLPIRVSDVSVTSRLNL